MAPVGAQPDMAGFHPMEANTKAHIRRLINHIRAVLKQEAQMTELLIAQANTNPEEQGWLFAVRTWCEGWPQGMEDYIELGKRPVRCNHRQGRQGQEHHAYDVCT